MKIICQNHFTWLDLKNIFFSLTIHKILTSLTSCSACKNEITNQNIIVVQRSNNLLIRRTSLPKFTLNKAKSIDNHNKQVANWFVYLAACFQFGKFSYFKKFRIKKKQYQWSVREMLTNGPSASALNSSPPATTNLTRVE